MEEENKCNYKNEVKPSSIHELSIRNIRMAGTPTILIDFSPQSSKCIKKVDDSFLQTLYKGFPIFNDDRQYFTPSFMLEYDKIRTPQNLQTFLRLHQNRVQEIVLQQQQLFIPKPTKANSFCCICKSFFEDYLEHVTFTKHVENLRGSKFVHDINEICKKFIKQDVVVEKMVKGKRIKKNRLKCKKNEKQLFRMVSTEAQNSILMDDKK